MILMMSYLRHFFFYFDGFPKGSNDSNHPDIKRQANTVVAWKTRAYSSVAADLTPLSALFPQTNLASACLVHLFPPSSGTVHC